MTQMVSGLLNELRPSRVTAEMCTLVPQVGVTPTRDHVDKSGKDKAADGCNERFKHYDHARRNSMSSKAQPLPIS